MNEQIKNEISNGAKAIGLTEEEALNKFEEICQENNIETTNPLAKGLWRSYVASVKRTQNTDSSGNSNESYYKKAFGFLMPSISRIVGAKSRRLTCWLITRFSSPGPAIIRGTWISSSYKCTPWPVFPCSLNCSPWSAVMITKVLSMTFICFSM